MLSGAMIAVIWNAFQVSLRASFSSILACPTLTATAPEAEASFTSTFDARLAAEDRRRGVVAKSGGRRGDVGRGHAAAGNDDLLFPSAAVEQGRGLGRHGGGGTTLRAADLHRLLRLCSADVDLDVDGGETGRRAGRIAAGTAALAAADATCAFSRGRGSEKPPTRASAEKRAPATPGARRA